MASKCISDCVNIKNDAVCLWPGTTYAKIHKWPEAEVEFVRSISLSGRQRRTASLDSIVCRQNYLRSYTFSRKEEIEDGDRAVGDPDDLRNDQRSFGEEGRKKVAKKGLRTCKQKSHMSFVGRFVWKCLSCTSHTK